MEAGKINFVIFEYWDISYFFVESGKYDENRNFRDRTSYCVNLTAIPETDAQCVIVTM